MTVRNPFLLIDDYLFGEYPFTDLIFFQQTFKLLLCAQLFFAVMGQRNIKSGLRIGSVEAQPDEKQSNKDFSHNSDSLSATVISQYFNGQSPCKFRGLHNLTPRLIALLQQRKT
jgi:hypothetical protein